MKVRFALPGGVQSLKFDGSARLPRRRPCSTYQGSERCHPLPPPSALDRRRRCRHRREPPRMRPPSSRDTSPPEDPEVPHPSARTVCFTADPEPHPADTENAAPRAREPNPFDHQVRSPRGGSRIAIQDAHEVIPDFLFDESDLSAATLVRVADDPAAGDQGGRLDAIHRAAVSAFDPDGLEGWLRHRSWDGHEVPVPGAAARMPW